MTIFHLRKRNEIRFKVREPERLGTLHTRDREPVTIALQVVSLVEKRPGPSLLHTTEYVNARWM